jgi:transcription factor C subunit 7
MNWTIDHKTGIYHSTFPTPTGNAADPTLTALGVKQSEELSVYISGTNFEPKPWRVYSSPFYRCLQTVKPSVEALKKQENKNAGADLDVRIENGLG